MYHYGSVSRLSVRHGWASTFNFVSVSAGCTPMRWLGHVVLTSCWNREICAGSAMSCARTTDGSLKTSSAENLVRENAPQSGHGCQSKICTRRTWVLWQSIWTIGMKHPSNPLPGDRQCRKVCPNSKRHSLSKTGEIDRKERLHLRQVDQRTLLQRLPFPPRTDHHTLRCTI